MGLFQPRPRWASWLSAIMFAVTLLHLKYHFLNGIFSVLWFIGFFVVAAASVSPKE